MLLEAVAGMRDKCLEYCYCQVSILTWYTTTTGHDGSSTGTVRTFDTLDGLAGIEVQ